MKKEGQIKRKGSDKLKKKVLSALLCVLVLLTVAAASGCGGKSAVLNVYNWGVYIAPGVIKQFKKETSIKVNYTTYDSNEALYSKISSGAASYDVIVPSDYMISRMIEEDMLAELNFDNIPNFQYIGDSYKSLEYDSENKYSVPYTWGNTVIFYDKTKVDAEDIAEQSIDLLWNKKYSGQILMFDNPRDAFGLALKKLGYSMNTTNKSEWEAAAAELKAQKPLVQAYVMDQIYDKMISGEALIAPYYAGDLLVMQADNPNIECYIPKEGANLFADAMCVLKTSTHKTEAEMFINFMCRTDIAVKNAEEIGYATPQMEARSLLDPSITSNRSIYPPDEALVNAEIFINLPPDITRLQSSLWTDIKKD